MPDALHDHIQAVARNRDLSGYNEDQTKQAILLPILQMLGWPIFSASEVYPEYSAGRGRVDYALRVGNANKVFVEAKRCSVDLEAHQEQLLRYAFQHGVSLAVLTNGTLWWFYLPLREGAWEQRKFYSIDLLQREPSDVAARLRGFLARDAVASGAAIAEAEKVLTSRQRRVEVERTLPTAWNGMLADPDDALIELVRDRVEQLCGFSPTDGEVRHYLRHAPEASRVRLSGVRGPSPRAFEPEPPPAEPTSRAEDGEAVPLGQLLQRDMRKTKPTHLVIGNDRIAVRGWSKLSVAFVEWLSDAGLLTAESLPILSYSGKDRYFVHTSPAHRKESLGGKWRPVAPGYVDTNFSAKDHLKNLRATLRQIGHEDLDVRIELRA